MDLMVMADVDDDGQNGAHGLACHRGDGGAGHLHAREAKEAENQNGIKNDIDDRAHQLGHHGKAGAACGLEQALKAQLAEKAEGAGQADGGVVRAVVHNLHHVGLRQEERPGEREADDGKDHKAAQGQEDAGVGRLVHHLLVFLAQRAGEHGIHADSRTNAHGNGEILQGEGQRNGVEGILADPRHEDAVHHIIKGLHHHGDHHGDRHAGKQPADGHGAHLILRQGRSLFRVLHVFFLTSFQFDTIAPSLTAGLMKQ